MKKLILGIAIGGLLGGISTAKYLSNQIEEQEAALYVSFNAASLASLTIASSLFAEKRYCLELSLAKGYIKEIGILHEELSTEYRYWVLTDSLLKSANKSISDYNTKFISNSEIEC